MSETIPNIETFDVDSKQLQSINDVIAYADSICLNESNTNNFDTSCFVKKVNEIIKKKFHLGVAHYSLKENWIAALSGKLIWSHFSAIVHADDILKHNVGLCNQQSIVFMKVLNTKGMSVRSLGLGYPQGPGHFACEVWYNNEWHLYDVSKEPNWHAVYNKNKSFEYYLNNKDTLYMLYNHQWPRQTFDKLISRVVYGEVNATPGLKMYWFQRITKWLTYFLPLLFLVLFLIQLRELNSKLRNKL
jgi:hypothetical protein